MKKSNQTLKFIVIIPLLIILICVKSIAQDKYSGKWGGKFMGDFNLVIHLQMSENNEYFGRLQMFNNGQMIQDDKMSDILINDRQISFYLEAKQTTFKGSFNEQISEFNGFFIFPDGSEHPLHVLKADNTTQTQLDLDDSINAKYPKADLITDFNYLIEKLIEHHPSLYYYFPEDSMKDFWEQTYYRIDKEMTLRDFYKLTAPITNAIHCSHTGIRVPQNVQHLINENCNYFPFQLIFLNGKTFSISAYNKQEPSINYPFELISINDTPTTEIIQELLQFIPAEGYNLTTKYNELNKNFKHYYYFLDNSESFDIEYIGINNKLNKLNVNACSYSDFNTKNEKATSPLNFSIDNNIGLLTIGSFTFSNIEKYINLLDSIFIELREKEITKLVLDLRNNGGGHPIFAAQLLSYFTQNEFTYFERNPDITEFEPLYEPMQPSKHQFNGDLFVFINGGCLSTTGHLISLLKYHTTAKFIGEEPGSSYRCNDFSIRVVLPATGIDVNIPRTTFKTKVSGEARETPFKVDYEIEESLEDILNGTDSYKKLLHSLVKEIP